MHYLMKVYYQTQALNTLIITNVFIIYNILNYMNHSISTMSGKTKIKIVLLGGQAVGKSSIIQKYIHDRFQETANPTVGIDFLAKNISHKAKSYRMQLWDTAGQERFRSLIPSYLKDAHCALIVFDVTSKDTFNQTQMWLNIFNENKVGDGFLFLIANKIDLDYREVSKDDGQQKARKLGLPYFQISAKSGQNIQQLFFKLIDYFNQKPSGVALSLEEKKEKEVIKQQQLGKEEQQVKGALQQTDTKITNEINQGVSASNNVVLKNEKLSSKGEKKKTCC